MVPRTPHRLTAVRDIAENRLAEAARDSLKAGSLFPARHGGPVLSAGSGHRRQLCVRRPAAEGSVMTARSEARLQAIPALGHNVFRLGVATDDRVGNPDQRSWRQLARTDAD
jgi:hypothetical protein